MVTNSISAKKQELLSCQIEISAIWQHVRDVHGINTSHPRLQRLAYLQSLALQLEAELREIRVGE